MESSRKFLLGIGCVAACCLGIYGIWYFEWSPTASKKSDSNLSQTKKSLSDSLPVTDEKKEKSGSQAATDAQAIAEEKIEPSSPPQMADPMHGKDPYANAPIISQGETPPDSQGRFQRIKVVQTDFKYPLLRIVQMISRDPQSGTDHVLGQEVMVADHIIVKLQSNSGEEALHALNQKYGAFIQKKMLAPNTYLIGFNSQDIHALPQIIQNYSQEVQHISYAEPDYIVRPLENSNSLQIK